MEAAGSLGVPRYTAVAAVRAAIHHSPMVNRHLALGLPPFPKSRRASTFLSLRLSRFEPAGDACGADVACLRGPSALPETLVSADPSDCVARTAEGRRPKTGRNGLVRVPSARPVSAAAAAATVPLCTLRHTFLLHRALPPSTFPRLGAHTSQHGKPQPGRSLPRRSSFSHGTTELVTASLSLMRSP